MNARQVGGDRRIGAVSSCVGMEDIADQAVLKEAKQENIFSKYCHDFLDISLNPCSLLDILGVLPSINFGKIPRFKE